MFMKIRHRGKHVTAGGLIAPFFICATSYRMHF